MTKKCNKKTFLLKLNIKILASINLFIFCFHFSLLSVQSSADLHFSSSKLHLKIIKFYIRSYDISIKLI